MHYSSAVTINLDRASVLQLLSDRANDVRWRRNLMLCEPIVGEPGRPGAETRLLYRDDGGVVRERMEHVESNRLPDAIEYSLRSPNITEYQIHQFVEEGEQRTRWVVESTVEFHHAGLALRRHSAMVEQETKCSMEAFRDFAEGPSGRARLAPADSITRTRI